MSNDGKQADLDLEFDLQDDESIDSSMDGERTEDDQPSDEVAKDLDFEIEESKEDKAEKAATARENSARGWAAKIMLGKAKIGDIPANHSYLLDRVNELTGGLNKEAKKEEVKQGVTKDDVKFEFRKERLKSLDMTPTEAKALTEKFKYYAARGFSPNEALDEALAFVGVSETREKAEMPKVRIGGAAAPVKKFTGTEDPAKMSRRQLAEYVAHNKSVR